VSASVRRQASGAHGRVEAGDGANGDRGGDAARDRGCRKAHRPTPVGGVGGDDGEPEGGAGQAAEHGERELSRTAS
jgi:hypothetical protein